MPTQDHGLGVRRCQEMKSISKTLPEIIADNLVHYFSFAGEEGTICQWQN